MPDREQKLVQSVLQVFNALKRERQLIEPMYKEITDYICPKFSGWDFNIDQDITAGEMIFDGTAIACLNKLADGIYGWLCSPAIEWLRVAPSRREDEDNKPFMEYLKEIELYLYDVFNRSNFYDAAAEAVTTCCALGTVTVYVDEAEPLERPVYTPLHPREVYISENEFNEVDTLYRYFEMTNRQVVSVFKGDGHLSQKLIDQAKKDPEARVRILHAIYPRETNGIISTEKPYASVYLLVGTGRSGGTATCNRGALLREGGLDFKHFEAWRFRHSSDQCYGTSPGMDAIYDVKTLNLMAKTMLDTAQLAARPTMYGDERFRGNNKIRPGGWLYGPVGMKPEPVVSTVSYPVGMDAMQKRVEIVREHFKTDFFQSISQLQNTSRDRTATEVMEIKAESAAVLGAVVGRVQSEFLDPIVRLTLSIEVAAGRAPKPPEGLDETKGFTFQFVGPLAQAVRKYVRTNGIMAGISAAANIAQATGATDVMMNLDVNKAVREVVIAAGYPHEALVDKEVVAQAQEQAAQARAAQAQAEAQAQAMQAAGGIKNITEAQGAVAR